MDIHAIANNLCERDGLFFSKNASEISYPEHGNEICAQIEDNSFWFKHRNDCIASVVDKFGAGRPFFDIGGGNGFVSKRMQEMGLETVLVEPGLQGCLNARKRQIKQIVCSTLEDAGFLPDSLDSAGMFDVVEHIEDDMAFLRGVHRFLKRDGLVYITVPAYQALWSDEDVVAGHYRRYSLPEITQKLESVGFHMVYSSYIFSILPLPIYFLRVLPGKFMKPKQEIDLNQAQGDHQAKDGLVSQLLGKCWQWELAQIKQQKRIGFGGSCLLVAKK